MNKMLYNLEQKLSTKRMGKTADAVTLLFFFGVILAPILALFATVFMNWDTVMGFIFNDEILGNQAWKSSVNALKHSFQIAFIVMIIDIIIGLPMFLILIIDLDAHIYGLRMRFFQNQKPKKVLKKS